MAVSTHGFTTEAMIIALYAQLGFDNILDDVTGAAEDAVIDQFIRDAEQTVRSRLTMFDPDDMVGNQWIESRTTWIAAHYISKRRGNEHYFEDMYVEAMRELDAIATGELPAPMDIPLRAHTYPAMTNFTIDERFAVAKIRVRPTISIGGTYEGQDTTFGYFWGWI